MKLGRTGAVVAGAAILALASGTGGAVAGSLITGAQIKDGTVTTHDIRDETLRLSDLGPKALAAVKKGGAAGPVGPAGAAGAAGQVGPVGAAGQVGPQGPAGASGKDGAPGPAGPAGQDGNDGAIGPQGPSGDGGLLIRVFRSAPTEATVAGSVYTAQAACPTGTAPVSGGFVLESDPGVLEVTYSGPGGPDNWRIQVRALTSSPTATFRSTVLCSSGVEWVPLG